MCKNNKSEDNSTICSSPKLSMSEDDENKVEEVINVKSGVRFCSVNFRLTNIMKKENQEHEILHQKKVIWKRNVDSVVFGDSETEVLQINIDKTENHLRSRCTFKLRSSKSLNGSDNVQLSYRNVALRSENDRRRYDDNVFHFVETTILHSDGKTKWRSHKTSLSRFEDAEEIKIFHIFNESSKIPRISGCLVIEALLTILRQDTSVKTTKAKGNEKQNNYSHRFYSSRIIACESHNMYEVSLTIGFIVILCLIAAIYFDLKQEILRM